MILGFVALAWAGPNDAPPRARYQMLVAEWERSHGNSAAAASAAQTALLHDPGAAAPRLVLAELQRGEPGTADSRLRLLEEAAQARGASAAVWTALGLARIAAGQAESNTAFAESERRGGGSVNYAAWVPTLTGTARMAVSARWLGLVEPGLGGRALRATFADAPAPAATSQLCDDALAAQLLGEPLAPSVIASRCGPAGRGDDARLALLRLADSGADVSDAQAVLSAWTGSR